MNKKLKVAVIGIGQMGTYHARIYKAMPQVDLVAICEYDDQRRKEAESEFGVDGYKDYKNMLQNSDIDAVSIVLPDNIHREAVEIAVENDKHILLEKPLAKELKDGEALYELTKNYDKIFTVGFLLRYDPRFNLLKQRLDNGELGDIIHLYARRNSPIVGPRRYIGESDLSMHVMSHDIDYINWYMDSKPVKVFAKSRSVKLKEYDMDDVIYAIVTYDNGAIATMEACWVLPENSPTSIDDKVELVGTKGTAYIDSSNNGVRFITDEEISYPDTRHWYDVNGEVGGDLAEQLRGFVNNVLYDNEPLVSVKDAYNSLKVVDAIERSIEEGKEVEL